MANNKKRRKNNKKKGAASDADASKPASPSGEAEEKDLKYGDFGQVCTSVGKWLFHFLSLAQVTKKILSQIEYYFSNRNLWKDECLTKKINQDPERWVELPTIMIFSKLAVA
jgi:hypothetical protein